MKNIFAVILLFIISGTLAAQTVGYTGKRFVVKTDVLNGKFLGFRNADVEIVLFRKLSIVAGVRYHQGNYKQKFNDNDKDYISSIDDYYGSYSTGSDTVMESKATAKALTYKFQLRLYPNAYVSAPKGFFLYWAYEFGKATVTNAASLEWQASSETFIPKFSDTDIEDIKISQYEFGFGYQEIFFDRLVFEWSLALTATAFNRKGNPESLRYTTGMSRYYGPNLLPFGKGNSDGMDITPTGTGGTDGAYKGAFGFSAYFKIGMLVF